MSEPRERGHDRSGERWNAWLTVLLVLGLVGVTNHLARRELALRRDLSEDGLYALSDASRRVLGRLDDVLSVHAFFTEELESGVAAIHKGQVEAQLEEFVDLAGGRLVLDVRDPSVSSQARQDAESHGIPVRRVPSRRGVGLVEQPVYRGLLLRYRGRVEVVPWADPWTLEAEFVGAVARILSDHRPRLGWVGEDLGAEPNPAMGSTYVMRQNLRRRFDLVGVPLGALEAGEPVPEDLDLLVVLARDTPFRPRAVFEVEQALQRGVPVLLFLDPVIVVPDPAQQELRRFAALRSLRGDEEPPRTGFEGLLTSFGLRPSAGHVWDAGSPGERRVWLGGGATETLRLPEAPLVRGEGFARDLPPTAGLRELRLFWAQALLEGPLPAGLARQDLLTTSAESWVVPWYTHPGRQQDVLEARTADLRRTPRGHFALASSLRGRFPSPWSRGAPAPFDASAPAPEPGAPLPTTDEPVRAGERDGQLVVVGDADLLRDPIFRPALLDLADGNAFLFLSNLIDWCLADEDLIELRTRLPRERPLRDLLEEQLAAEGLLGLDEMAGVAELTDRARRRQAAQDRAARARWWAMGLPVAVSLALLAVLGLVRWTLDRRSR